ncbi:MAG TPA: hypothetical protein VF283_18560 [Bryobacteraceae bacterium]
MKLARLAWLAGPLFGSLLLAQQQPDLSGNWQLNAAKSQVNAQDQNVTLSIQDDSPKIQFKRVVQGAGGHSVVSTFTCQIGGQQCDFDEGGHKAKVSLWYDGPALVILKTDGPKSDSVTQWQLSLSSDGKTMNVTLTHIVPNENPEKLVFSKAGS